MTQWRDERDAETGSIEELGSVALPTRVGSARSGLVPAVVVGALLAAVVAVGVSGRAETPRDPLPPVAAADASPETPAPGDPTQTPALPPGAPPPGPTPRQPATPGASALPEVRGPSGDLRLSLVLESEDERLLSIDLNAKQGFYRAVPLTEALGEVVRARLFGRLGANERMEMATVPVPRVPDGSLDLPLELGGGPLPAALRTEPKRGPSSDPLHYRLRLEQSSGRSGSPLLVAEVFAPKTTTYTESSTLDEARDRLVASVAVREALTLSTRCSRMLDPRIGRSEANLDGCLRFFARQGVTSAVNPGGTAQTAPRASANEDSAPAAPAPPEGAAYWLDLRLRGETIALEVLEEVADGTYEAYFPYDEAWYVKAPVLGLYGRRQVDTSVATITTLQLTKGPRGQPGTPVELAAGPLPAVSGRPPIWSVTLTRGQPDGLAVLVQVGPRLTR